ncbi:MAG: NADH-quinone oxidoreductase subunit N [Syntrophorhabdaceae bacterium]|nr:NADH-quinone oxidoreductase subunit N [Syntrophorhabdaceae bacterium]
MVMLPELSICFFSIFFLFSSIGRIRDGLILKLAKALSLVVLLLTVFSIGAKGEMFYGAIRVDLFSQIFKTLIALGFSIVILMYGEKDEVEREYLSEYFMFLGFSALGLMMLVSSVELISIVISLEISSYSLYVILPLRKGQTRIQVEGSVKYLFFGAVSTGIMLFGMGYLYGLSRSTFLVDIIRIFPGILETPVGLIALIFTLTGFFFKLSLFPFHFWSPDIYEGASNTTTTFIGTLPKLGAAALLLRITLLASPGNQQLINILIVLSALSMTFGNFVGLVQKDIKRLLAYSGIAHAGYLLLGIIALNREGAASVIFYITIYLFMNLACFYVLILLSRTGENITLNDLVGLSRRSPLLALLLAVSAFSLAGIPPTGGFTGKLFLLTSAFKAGHLNIVIIGAVNTVISIFYYLNLVRMSYSKESSVLMPLTLSGHEKGLCYILIFLILFMGVMPFGILEIFKFSIP